MVPRRSPIHSHAIVIGGSMAGLLAARVLADHFARVSIIERDRFGFEPGARVGVPQGRHAHALFLGGQRIVDELLPDVAPALRAAGAVEIDMGSDVRWHHFGHWKARFASGLTPTFCSRPLLEAAVARAVAGIPNVTLLAGHDVEGLAVTEPPRRTRGVRLRRAGGEATTLAADLVVDASGRGSRLPQWLDALGCGHPTESEVEVRVGYASRPMRLRRAHDWKALLVVPRPPLTRAAFVTPIEGERHLVTLAGWLGDHPPLDDAGWRAFAASLPVPDVAHALRDAEPMGPTVAHHLPSNRRRHYELLADMPARLVVLGDALCSFNPVYGQGMTVAAQSAVVLRDCLQRAGRRLDRLAWRVQGRIARVVDEAWSLATLEDLRYGEIAGERPPTMRWLHWYTARLHEAAGHDPQVARRFYEVMHMLASPARLFRPDVAWRVLRTRHRADVPAADTDAWDGSEAPGAAA